MYITIKTFTRFVKKKKKDFFSLDVDYYNIEVCCFQESKIKELWYQLHRTNELLWKQTIAYYGIGFITKYIMEE